MPDTSRPNFEDIKDAYVDIQDKIHLTPVLTSALLNDLASKNAGLDDKTKLELFFKCENLQKTGAFKARGACNAIIKLLRKYPSNN